MDPELSYIFLEKFAIVDTSKAQISEQTDSIKQYFIEIIAHVPWFLDIWNQFNNKMQIITYLQPHSLKGYLLTRTKDFQLFLQSG